MQTLDRRLRGLEAHQAPPPDECACPVHLVALDYRTSIAALAPLAAGGPAGDDAARDLQRCRACGRLPAVLIMPLPVPRGDANGQP